MDSLEDLIDARQNVSVSIEELEAIKSELDQKIKTGMVEAKLANLQTDRWTATLVPPGETRTLDRGKLIAAGVPPEVMEAATTVRDREGYVRVVSKRVVKKEKS